MHVVLLSGGSGKRLWPLSNEVRSKQFLKVMKNGESMLQRIYGQLKRAGLADNLVISTSAEQNDSILSQLGRVSTVTEPARRDTFPAVALASAYLYYERKCGEGESVIVLPIDPYVEDGYFQTLYKLNEVLDKEQPEIVLMGAKPVYPSEKYGYIIPEEKTEISRVRGFKEKPDLKTAERLIADGAMWNCGVFAFKLGYMLSYIKKHIAFQTYRDVLSQYSSLEKNSFDYVVTEKASSIFYVAYEGEWVDIGTWNTLTEVMDARPIGNARMADDCVNTHVINELDIPVVVMGAENMIIAASPDGVLVAEKEQSSYIKRYVDNIALRPMYEEREWGEYKVLDITVNEDGTKVLTKRKKIKKDAVIGYQSHKSRSEVWTVLNGKCVITINGRAHEALAGDTFSISEGTKHGLRAVTDAEIIEIQVGMELLDDGTEYELTIK